MAEQPQWFKSSYSGTPNNECVECASAPDGVLVRDSKNIQGPCFRSSFRAWTSFTRALNDGGLSQR
ncbi:DUF397 domain-containing protein [Streptomyces profundus]|uniref:DUF397 domain-containing protein n=1 Tax=Streptomyces profundus TaxID=2867410 RepID=UPI003CC889FE